MATIDDGDDDDAHDKDHERDEKLVMTVRAVSTRFPLLVMAY